MALTVNLIPYSYSLVFPSDLLTPDTLLGSLVEQGYDTVNIEQPFVTPLTLELLHTMLTQGRIDNHLMLTINAQNELNNLAQTGRYLGYPMLDLIADPRYLDLIGNYLDLNLLTPEYDFPTYQRILVFAITHHWDQLLKYVLQKTQAYGIDAKLLGLAVLFNNEFAVKSFLQGNHSVNPLFTNLIADDLENFGIPIPEKWKVLFPFWRGVGAVDHPHVPIFEYAVLASPAIFRDLLSTVDTKDLNLANLTKLALQPEWNRPDLLKIIYDPQMKLPLPVTSNDEYDINNKYATHLDQKLLDVMIDRTMANNYENAMEDQLHRWYNDNTPNFYVIDRFAKADPETLTTKVNPAFLTYVRKLNHLITRIRNDETDNIDTEFDDMIKNMDFRDFHPSVDQFPMLNYDILRSLTTNPNILSQLDAVLDKWSAIKEREENEENEGEEEESYD